MSRLGKIHGDSARGMDKTAKGLHAVSFALSSIGMFFLVPFLIGDLPLLIRLALAAAVGGVVEWIIMGNVRSWSRQVANWEFSERGSVKLFVVCSMMLILGFSLDYVISNEGRKYIVEYALVEPAAPDIDSINLDRDSVLAQIHLEYRQERKDIENRYAVLNVHKGSKAEALARIQKAEANRLASLREEYDWAANESGKALVRAEREYSKGAAEQADVAERKEAQILVAVSTRDELSDNVNTWYDGQIEKVQAAHIETLQKFNASKGGWSMALFILVLVTGIGILLLHLYYEMYRVYAGLPMEGEVFDGNHNKKKFFKQFGEIRETVWGLAHDSVHGVNVRLAKGRELRRQRLDEAEPLSLPSMQQIGLGIGGVLSIWAILYIVLVRGQDFDMTLKADLVSTSWLSLVGVFTIVSAIAYKAIPNKKETDAQVLDNQPLQSLDKNKTTRLMDLCHKAYARSITSVKESTKERQREEFEKTV
jgi:hypothetical protein